MPCTFVLCGAPDGMMEPRQSYMGNNEWVTSWASCERGVEESDDRRQTELKYVFEGPKVTS